MIHHLDAIPGEGDPGDPRLPKSFDPKAFRNADPFLNVDQVDDMDLGAHIDTLRALKLQTSYHPLDSVQMVNSRTVSCRSRERPQSSTWHS
ncbi:hypothetical protein PVAP13_1KG082254 [Panicum virgatum]|uniref:Uncharacterized protein n=1 Tax=Panicum virgatum TaxID=38727 RepID=A0A8T0XGK5_PANVG|nr:hypothetical protein PVAP13_1KG082254 [Panicum virgatum]